MSKIFILVILSSLCLGSCTNQVKDSWDKTMHTHDEVMLKMQDNGDLQMQLNELIKTGKSDTNSILFTYTDTLQKAIDDLALADEEMMDWMAAIRSPKSGDDVDSTLNYHQEQSKAIIEIGNQMDLAATNAQNILSWIETKR